MSSITWRLLCCWTIALLLWLFLLLLSFLLILLLSLCLFFSDFCGCLVAFCLECHSCVRTVLLFSCVCWVCWVFQLVESVAFFEFLSLLSLVYFWVDLFLSCQFFLFIVPFILIIPVILVIPIIPGILVFPFMFLPFLWSFVVSCHSYPAHHSHHAYHSYHWFQFLLLVSFAFLSCHFSHTRPGPNLGPFPTSYGLAPGSLSVMECGCTAGSINMVNASSLENSGEDQFQCRMCGEGLECPFHSSLNGLTQGKEGMGCGGSWWTEQTWTQMKKTETTSKLQHSFFSYSTLSYSSLSISATFSYILAVLFSAILLWATLLSASLSHFQLLYLL